MHQSDTTTLENKPSVPPPQQTVPSAPLSTNTTATVTTTPLPADVNQNITKTTTTKPKPKQKPDPKPKLKAKPKSVTKPRVKSKPVVSPPIGSPKTIFDGITPSLVESAITKEVLGTGKKRSVKKRVLSAGTQSTAVASTSTTTKRIPNIAEELAKNRTYPKFLLHSSSDQRSFESAGAPTITSTATPSSTVKRPKPTSRTTKTKVSKPKSALDKGVSGTTSTTKAESSSSSTTMVSKTLKVKESSVQIVEPNLARPVLMSQETAPNLLLPTANPNTSGTPSAIQSTTTKNPPLPPLLTTKRLPTLKKSKSTVSSLLNSTSKGQLANGSGTATTTAGGPAASAGVTATVKTASVPKAKRTKSASTLPIQGQQQQGLTLPSAASNDTTIATNALKKPPPINPPMKLAAALQGTQEEASESHHSRGSPVMAFDIPLYSTESNEYLDENGTVTFNLFELINKAKLPPSLPGSENKNEDLKLAKRNKLFGEVPTGDDDDDDDDGEEEKKKKKKSHPMKGKSLIGKYDVDDPFIDDSELLLEEQRALAEDGFFVFFGPLVASSDSVSSGTGSRSGGTGNHVGVTRKSAGNSRK